MHTFAHGVVHACICGLYIAHGACIMSTYASAVFFLQSQAALFVILHSESIHECWGQQGVVVLLQQRECC